MSLKSFIRKLVIITSSILLINGCSNQSNEVFDEVVSTKSYSTDVYQDYLNRDVKDDVFYFVLPDRFNNANLGNDLGAAKPSISHGGLDTTSKWAFHGGDIQGIEEKLDYIKGMGITAIWMTPVLRNKAVQKGGFAHHGYWIVDFTKIDPHFGSNDDLKRLINKAHEKGIKIFFDIITNHTADVIKYEECHEIDGRFRKGKSYCIYKSLEQVTKGDKYTRFIPKHEKEQLFPNWLNNPEYYHNQGDSTFEGESSLNGDFNGLDDLNTEHPFVLKGMIDIYKNIISEFKPDGFRIDTVRHVQLPFWQDFGPEIMQHAKDEGIPNFHIFGEVYDPNPIELSKFTTKGKLPAVLDFGFQHAVENVFYKGLSTSNLQTLFSKDDYYNDNDSRADELLTFLSNHDMGRAGYFINKYLPDISLDEKLKRSELSHAFMLLSRGIPVVYYGDEQGFTGDGNDVDSREDMFASKVKSYNDNTLMGTTNTTAQDNFDENHVIYQTISKLTALRAEHVTLRRGDFKPKYFNDKSKAFAFSRHDWNEQYDYLVLFNLENKKETIVVDGLVGGYALIDGNATLTQVKISSDTKLSENSLNFALPPLSYAVFRSNNQLPVQTNLNLQLTRVDEVQGDNDRVSAHYQFTDTNLKSSALISVSTEIKMQSGEYIFVAEDRTFPFSAIIPKTLLQTVNTAIEEQVIRVTVKNSIGTKKVKEFKFLM